MSAPLLGHLDPEFLQIMDRTQDMLRQVFRTQNQWTLPVSGTGGAGMETCVVNLIEKGDPMVVCVNGLFGQRMVDVAQRAGANVTLVERPWGEAFDLNQIAEVVRKVRPKVVGLIQAETSTGALQPLEGLGAVCHECDALLLVDTVASLGGVAVEVDKWGIDAVYSGSQKCLSCPPGLAPVAFSPRAVGVITQRKTRVQSWYLDMALVQRYWSDEHFYHHTAPVCMIYALHEALRLILAEGLETRWARHQLNHRALKVGLAAMNIAYAAVEGHQLPTLNAVRIPPGVDDLKVRRQLLQEFNIEIGGGLGDFKGKVWRIGLMGFNATPNSVLLFLAALEKCLLAQGVRLNQGRGVAAANDVYLAAAAS
jgi:alanine-glyoxylate transaminase/serine-glyoxylate transaminase/serine-pyruvate transaminase